MRKLLTTLAFACGLGLALSPAGAQQNKALSYSSYLPPTHPSNRYGLEPLFKAVEQETKGSLRIELHPGGVIVGGKGTLSAVRDGLIDGGFIVSVYHQNEIPVNNAISDLALLAENPLVTMGALNETVLLNCPECLAEYRKYKVVYLGSYSTTPYKVMCKKPVRTLQDLKGLKMRASGTVYARLANKLGGVGVNMSNAEAYEAMERGQLDCIIGSVGWLESLSLWELAKNVIDLPMGAYFGGALLAFNEDSWKRIKDSDRAVFVKDVPAALAQLALGYIGDDRDVETKAKAKGVTMNKPDNSVVSVVAQHREEMVKNAIDDAKKRGAKNPEPGVRAFLRNLKKWEAIVARTGEDPGKFAQALREEIYNKVKF